jgi:tRNA pseudouridine13 synthase
LSVPEIDHKLGMEVYATKTGGIGGAIRKTVEDFIVEEILLDGSKAVVEKSDGIVKPALGATTNRQRYLLCVLIKRNWDTFAAIKSVAKALGIEQARIQFAGIKDAKAITAQYVTFDGVPAEEVAKVAYRDVELRPIGYFREPLSTFYLLGNNFTITLKDITPHINVVQEQITRIVQEVEDSGGIPNFYGHQRFGTTRPITHIVGKALVKGNIEEAAMLFLAKHSLTEHPTSAQARLELQESQDFKVAYENFPSQLRYERSMIMHLIENPGDYIGAFRCLPLKLRMLFVQAYQSILFNRFLSERIKRGFELNRAEAGDYVLNVERSGLPMVRTGKLVDATKLDEVNLQIKAGKMRVALPILGFGQKFSQGEIGEIQHEILQAEGIELPNFRISALPEINGKGELRAIVTPVKNFTAKSIAPDVKSTSKIKANLEFMLFRGSYATVLLREVMKSEDPITAGF